VSQLVYYSLKRGFVESLFEVKHFVSCLLLFVEAFCDILVESGYMIVAAILFSETEMACR